MGKPVHHFRTGKSDVGYTVSAFDFYYIVYTIVTWEEDAGHHSRKHDQEEGRELQVARQDGAGFNIGDILGCKSSLDNDLQQQIMLQFEIQYVNEAQDLC